jgi:beta-N-acetylhexosaminidase
MGDEISYSGVNYYRVFINFAKKIIVAMNLVRSIILSIFVLFLCKLTIAQSSFYAPDSDATRWVDSVFSSLTQTEKIGQMMMIRSFSNKDEDYYKEIERQIRQYNIGGICFFQGDPETQVKLINRWQAISKTPLAISIDGEWGLGMRYRDYCMSFPKQMTLGAIKNDTLIYKMGTAIARQMKRIGIRLSYSPDVDINNNPANPVINFRSFGEDKTNVAAKGLAYMKGLQDAGVAAFAKHFPGHGDTDVDSHFALPIIKYSKSRLDSMELYPFKYLIDNGIYGVMNAHLYFPAIETEENRPSSMSKKIVTDILRNELGFKGITITDGLEMDAILSFAEPGDIEVESVLAGNDIQLLPVNIDAAMTKILAAVESGKIPQSTIDEACKRILLLKYCLGINKNIILDENNVIEDVNTFEDKCLRRELYAAAITAIKNEKMLPLKLNTTIKTCCVVISDTDAADFEENFSNYCAADFYKLDLEPTKKDCATIKTAVKEYDRVIVFLASKSFSLKNKYNISEQALDLIASLSECDNSVLCMAANTYCATIISGLNNFDAIVIGYEAVADVFQLLPQALFGAIEVNGSLPVTINDNFKVNAGIQIHKTDVLYYPSADEIAYHYGNFEAVDSIVKYGINVKAYPGCQIFVAHKGQVIYNKAFGNYTYSSKSKKVSVNTVYDMASVTKIAATTLSVMKLQEGCLLDVDKPLSYYVPYLRSTNKSKVIIREAMSHQAGFIPYISVYKNIEQDKNLRKEFLSNTLNEDYTVKIAKDLYIKNGANYFITDTLANTELLQEQTCVYSDIGFIFIGEAIQNIVNQRLNNYVNDNFYSPLGLSRTTYLPLKKMKEEDIAPTEDDKTFRKQIVQGYVHDQTAAMLGGVAGHAGLFSTAKEIGVIMQMLLQDGNYGGVQYIQPAVIHEFTTTQFPEFENRKGCGFDKPLLIYEDNGPCCKSASYKSFGHTGFTGIYAWADPETELVYVFVSNRVFPNVDNSKLSKLNIRTNIHQQFYNIINDNKEY